MSRKVESIRLVSGSWPPEICGVGDFMARVSDALAARGAEVRRVRLSRRSLWTALSLLFGSHARRRELLYMSYPTEGYGKSLLPFLLAFGARRRIVLHLHEYGSKNRYARFLLRRFNGLQRIYFSNAPDRERFIADCGLAGQPQRTAEWQVMPTPSNVPVLHAHEAAAQGAPLRVVHFGQIRPFKGLETLADAFRELAGTQGLELTLAGGVPRGYEDYARHITAAFEQAGVRVLLDLPMHRLSQLFAQSDLGVFWFPDGADERRGSLAAAMAHGVLCITTHSARTSQPLRESTLGIDLAEPGQTGDGAARIVRAVRAVAAEGRSAGLAAIAEAGRRLAASASFDGIAQRLLTPAR